MATTDTFAHINEKIGMVAVVPEVTKGSPNWSFEAAGTHSTTTVQVDTSTGSGDHDTRLAGAADDLFNGCYVYFLNSTSTSALQGKMYPISDFAEAANVATITTATMASAPSDTDVFYVFGVLPATEATIPRACSATPTRGLLCSEGSTTRTAQQVMHTWPICSLSPSIPAITRAPLLCLLLSLVLVGKGPASATVMQHALWKLAASRKREQ